MSLTNSEYYVLHGKLDEERIMQLLAAEEDLQALLSVSNVLEEAYLEVKQLSKKVSVGNALKYLECVDNKFKQIEGEF